MATESSTASVQRPTTTAFFVQSAIAFGLSLGALLFGIVKLPVGPWERGFLALGLVFVVSSAFTLAKCVRDRQEAEEVTSKVDRARLDKLLTEVDPFKTPQP
ncbi:YiaA/YiaB family inner membrane protein [Streptomyces sp. ODS28]|uniref:YiaA/YiaB family inner membrane protein n=1 Tax=Streptomyces sp. ODS28 TaxID=3136688 RepID=UPI0031EADF10